MPLEVLAGEDEKSVAEPGGVQIPPPGVVEFGEPHARDDGAEGGVERSNVEGVRHACPSRSFQEV